MKQKIQAVCENMLNESSRLAKAYIKFESNGWGAADTLQYKARARQAYDDALTIASNFNLDVRAVVNDVEFLDAWQLPKSQYE